MSRRKNESGGQHGPDSAGRRPAVRLADPVAELCRLLKEGNAQVTFSLWCRSGLVPKYLERCECHRCRRDRGEPVTDETNALAQAQAKAADVKYRADEKKWYERQKPVLQKQFPEMWAEMESIVEEIRQNLLSDFRWEDDGGR